MYRKSNGVNKIAYTATKLKHFIFKFQHIHINYKYTHPTF